MATIVAVAVNAGTETKGAWPGPLAWVQAEPWWWVVGATVAAALGTFAVFWWELRTEEDDDANEPAAVREDGPRVAVSGGSVGVAAGQISGGSVTINQTIHQPPEPPSVPSPVFNLPARNPDFSGREDLLRQVEQGLAAGPVAVVAVKGMGGIGKTQIALEVAHRGWAMGRYEVAWWVRAESALTIAEDLAALGPGLDVPVVADQEQVVAGVRAELAERGRWLVVFDNAVDADSVRAWLPTGPGHVLVTSRWLDWRGLAAVSLSVEQFTPQESGVYLTQQTGETGPQVAELAKLLGHLPLALAQAAAYMAQHGGLSVSRYLELFRDRQAAGALLAHGLGGYPASVATTWLIHYGWLAERSPAALQLLRLCAFLDPDDINLSLLLSRPESLAEDVAGDLRQACGSQFGREQVIGALIGTALAIRVDDDRVRVHRLVGEVTRHQLTALDTDQHDRWASQAIELLNELAPERSWEPAMWPVMADLAAHVTTAAATAAENPATANALGTLGSYLYGRAEYASARTTLQRALAIKEAVYGPDHPQVATTLGNLGVVEQQLGELATARATQQ
ncbi:FxSxx-COOH system tetratricopeptide repeat protein, partial [Catellatospora paridis]